MRRHRVLLQTVLLLVLIWGAVAFLRGVAGSKQVTAERVSQEIEAAGFEDWSVRDGTDPGREKKLREIAGMVNRLDFSERQKTRDDRSTERFFRQMSGSEKKLFIDLTVRESMGKFMEAIDALPPEKRKEFVEQGLREIQSGKTGEEMERARELGDDLLETIAGEGMRAYFEKASADTKLDLAPLMESMNEVMQGLRGQEFGAPSR
jgi:phage-related protein